LVYGLQILVSLTRLQMVNGYAQTSEKIALSKLLGGRVLAPVRAAPRRRRRRRSA